MDFLPNAHVDGCGCSGPPPIPGHPVLSCIPQPCGSWPLAGTGDLVFSLCESAWTLPGCFTYSVLGSERGQPVGRVAWNFLSNDLPKVMMLLVVVIFGVGVIRSFFTPERTRSILCWSPPGASEQSACRYCWARSPRFVPAQQCPCSWALSAPECPWE